MPRPGSMTRSGARLPGQPRQSPVLPDLETDGHGTACSAATASRGWPGRTNIASVPASLLSAPRHSSQPTPPSIPYGGPWRREASSRARSREHQRGTPRPYTAFPRISRGRPPLRCTRRNAPKWIGDVASTTPGRIWPHLAASWRRAAGEAHRPLLPHAMPRAQFP